MVTSCKNVVWWRGTARGSHIYVFIRQWYNWHYSGHSGIPSSLSSLLINCTWLLWKEKFPWSVPSSESGLEQIFWGKKNRAKIASTVSDWWDVGKHTRMLPPPHFFFFKEKEEETLIYFYTDVKAPSIEPIKPELGKTGADIFEEVKPSWLERKRPQPSQKLKTPHPEPTEGNLSCPEFQQSSLERPG